MRPLRAADVDDVVALWIESWNATMPEIDFAARGNWLCERLAEHEAAGVVILCAVDARETPLGFVTVDPMTGHVDQLAVAPRCFGMGVATALIAAARGLSPGGLALEVNQENPRAVRFYKREGFVVTGESTVGANRRKTWLMRSSPPGSSNPP